MFQNPESIDYKRKNLQLNQVLKFALKKTQLNKKPNYRMENTFGKCVSGKTLLLKICKELLTTQQLDKQCYKKWAKDLDNSQTQKIQMTSISMKRYSTCHEENAN